MKTVLRTLPLLLAMPVAAQMPGNPRPDPWKALSFLLGRWEAKTASV